VPDLELCYLSATEALRRFHAKTLSPVDLLQAHISRAGEVGPSVNALANRYFDQALEQARAAESRYAKSDGRPRPLEGIPIGLKDDADWKDHPTTYGSLLFKDNHPSVSSPITERILKSGAIVHAQTTVPEFCCASVTWSRLWGVTRSPWNLELTCGGSSGGSGATLAAGLTTLATGSDIGGSIRIPAACNGVVGFKPPYGRNPAEAIFNLDHYNHNGPMARTVADCALLQNVLSGPHPRDIATLRSKLRIPADLKGIKGWRIAYSEDLGYFETSDEARARLRDVAMGLRQAGAIVEEVDLGWTYECTEAAGMHLGGLFGGWIGRLFDRRDEMTSYAQALGEEAAGIGVADLIHAAEIEGRMYERLSAVLSRYRALICPTLAYVPLKADHDPSQTPCLSNGKPGHWLFDWCMTYPFNMMSRCPVLAMPFEQTSWGIPFGVQIVGRTFDDVSVFRIGAALERQSPWYHRQDRRPALRSMVAAGSGH
jgi:amidase